MKSLKHTLASLGFFTILFASVAPGVAFAADLDTTARFVSVFTATTPTSTPSPTTSKPSVTPSSTPSPTTSKPSVTPSSTPSPTTPKPSVTPSSTPSPTTPSPTPSVSPSPEPSDSPAPFPVPIAPPISENPEVVQPPIVVANNDEDGEDDVEEDEEDDSSKISADALKNFAGDVIEAIPVMEDPLTGVSTRAGIFALVACGLFASVAVVSVFMLRNYRY